MADLCSLCMSLGAGSWGIGLFRDQFCLCRCWGHRPQPNPLGPFQKGKSPPPPHAASTLTGAAYSLLREAVANRGVVAAPISSHQSCGPS